MSALLYWVVVKDWPMKKPLPYFDSLDIEKRELLLSHLRAVVEANNRVNLTRIEDEEEALLLHIEDSLSALPEVEKAPKGQYADIGSGAGYPGIPIAVATGRETILVDSRKKKMDEVSNIVSSLGLSNQIQTYAGRAELLARSKPQKYALVTARALSRLSTLLELSSPLLSENGHLVCYKANVDDQEMQDAHRVAQMVGMKLLTDRSFVLGEEYSRRIITFKKVGITKIKLPRQEGQAQKNPL